MNDEYDDIHDSDEVPKTVKMLTPREVIAEEMARLRKYRVEYPHWYEYNSKLARDLYGNDLDDNIESVWNRSETKEFIASDIEVHCQVCGELFGLDEEFVFIVFDVNDNEYEMSVSLHKNVGNCVSKYKGKK